MINKKNSESLGMNVVKTVIKQNISFDDNSYKERANTMLYAFEKKFTHVSFRQSVLDSCYFRKCVFDSCDFTGTRFVASNFVGSTFPGSNFAYSSFERCQVDTDLITAMLPMANNQRRKFLRSLRKNFEQLGDSEAVNLAIDEELKVTSQYLWDACFSQIPYYRNKYSDHERVLKIFQYVKFRFLQIFWGNGEKSLNLLFSLILFISICSISILLKGSLSIEDFIKDFIKDFMMIFKYFFEVKIENSSLSESMEIIISMARFVFMSMFVSILVRRLSLR